MESESNGVASEYKQIFVNRLICEIPKAAKKEYYSTIKGYGLHFVKQKLMKKKLKSLYFITSQG